MKYKIFYMVLIFSISYSIALGVYVDQRNRNTIEVKQEIVDPRPEIIDTYFKQRNMPLYGYGKKMVEVADKNNLDWRLLPAIAIRESSGGKHRCNFNSFGWGSCRIAFSSDNEAIETVGYKLANLKVYKGKTTRQKLYYYNGTVVPTYPQEVIDIMDKISHEIN